MVKRSRRRHRPPRASNPNRPRPTLSTTVAAAALAALDALAGLRGVPRGRIVEQGLAHELALATPAERAALAPLVFPPAPLLVALAPVAEAA